MRGGTTSDQFVLEMDAAKAAIEQAIAGLSDDQASRREIDGWSAKDHLTHMTFWNEMRFFEVSRIARGGGPSFVESEVDSFNNLIADNRRAMSLEQVVADLDFVRGLVRDAVAACPDDRLDFSVYGEIGPHGAGHDTEHAEIIAAWRKKEGL